MVKKFWIGLGFALVAAGLPALVRAQTPAATTARNKQLVQRAFDGWAKGQGNLYDLMTPDAHWTLTGSAPLSKTYTSKQQFVDATVTPLFERLATPFVPIVHKLYAEGDVVIVAFEGSATANDGLPYHNTYCLLLTMKDGRIVKSVAFLDLLAYTELLRRVPARKP